MNGPVILNNAREQLADEIFAYREPNPSPLKISPWLSMSLLQKAIRRGEIELAQRAAATLLLIAPERLWRRCGAAAFEEVGVAASGTHNAAQAEYDRSAALRVSAGPQIPSAGPAEVHGAGKEKGRHRVEAR